MDVRYDRCVKNQAGPNQVALGGVRTLVKGLTRGVGRLSVVFYVLERSPCPGMLGGGAGRLHVRRLAGGSLPGHGRGSAGTPGTSRRERGTPGESCSGWPEISLAPPAGLLVAEGSLPPPWA